jgi:hypothetical protein
MTALAPVACPAAVANATCYQQLPTPGSSSPGDHGTLVPSSPQGSTSSAPTINPPPPAALPNTAAPTALPNTGAARVPASSSVLSRSVSSGGCQASGNNTDSIVPARGWDDFSAWIWGRVQDCINQGMARGGAGWNTSTGSGSTTSKVCGGKSKGEKSSSTKSTGSTKKSSSDSDSSPGEKKQGPRH